MPLSFVFAGAPCSSCERGVFAFAFFGVRRIDAALPLRTCLRRGGVHPARAWRNTFSAVILSAAKDLASTQCVPAPSVGNCGAHPCTGWPSF